MFGEEDGDEGPEGEPDPVVDAIERAPVAPVVEEEIELFEDVEEGPATWKQIVCGRLGARLVLLALVRVSACSRTL